MTKSINYTLGLALAFVLAFAGMASAATITDVEFNGEPQIVTKGKKSISVDVRIEVDPGETVENILWDIDGDDLGPRCDNVRDLGEGVHWVKVDIKTPPFEGHYGLDLDPFGIYGSYFDINCQAGNDIGGGYSEGDVVRVLDTYNNNSGDDFGAPAGIPDFMWDMFMQWFAVNGGNGGVVTPPAPVCEVPNYPTNVSTFTLQGWLIDHFYMTQAEVDTGPGIYGPKTSRAHTAALRACN